MSFRWFWSSLGCDCHPLALFDLVFRDDTMSYTHMSVGVSELNYHINILPLQLYLARLHLCTLGKALTRIGQHEAL